MNESTATHSQGTNKPNNPKGQSPTMYTKKKNGKFSEEQSKLDQFF